MSPKSFVILSRSLVKPLPEPESTEDSASSSTLRSSPPSSSDSHTPSPPPKDFDSTPKGPFTPYTDDPERGYDSAEMLQMQREMMDSQDVRLDALSRSVGRQRDISLQIGDELEVHTGLLEGLDHDLDRTDSRLIGARRKLERVARGAKANGGSSSRFV